LNRKLLAFVSHPIQHYVPWFAALQQELGGGFRVIFSSRHGVEASEDREFGKVFSWDMNLLADYEHEFYGAAPPRSSPAAGFRGIRFPGIYEYLKRERPAAVLIFGWLYYGYWEVALAARRLGIPYLLRGESNLLNQKSELKWWIKQRTVGVLCRGASRCIAIGKRNAELYLAYGVPSEKIRTAPYFVDNEFFGNSADSLRKDRGVLKTQFGLPPDAETVFLFMGKLIEKKHPDHLIKAWSRLPDDLRAKSAVLFGGSGSMMTSLQHQARNGGRTAFAGFLNRNDLPRAYAASDALVLPSDAGETWGLVVNEAMASGLPAIVSDRVGSAPDLVVPGKTGYTYEYGNIEKLTECMERVMREQIASMMGSAARAHVEVASVRRATDAVVGVMNELA
jgi:glycosyltransferase involved in cell wall biosynthesis